MKLELSLDYVSITFSVQFSWNKASQQQIDKKIQQKTIINTFFNFFSLYQEK
jgi:hypothetical protein